MVRSASAFLCKHKDLSSALQESGGEFVTPALEADGKRESFMALAGQAS